MGARAAARNAAPIRGPPLGNLEPLELVEDRWGPLPRDQTHGVQGKAGWSLTSCLGRARAAGGGEGDGQRSRWSPTLGQGVGAARRWLEST